MPQTAPPSRSEPAQPADATTAARDMLAQARELTSLGHLQAAREAYAQVIKLDAGSIDAWFELGQLCMRQSVPLQAVAALKRAVQLAPARWGAHIALASALEVAGQPQQAGASYHQALAAAALQKQPTSQVHWAMCQARKGRSNFAGALEALRQYMADLGTEQPQPSPNQHAQTQLELGDLLMKLGLNQLANRAFKEASATTDADLQARLAHTSLDHSLWQASTTGQRPHVKLQPAVVPSEPEPEPEPAEITVDMLINTGRATEALERLKQQAQLEPDQSPVRSSAALCSLYCSQLKPLQVAQLHYELFNTWGQNSREPSAFKNDRSPTRRLRVGFVSPNMHHQHPVGLLMQPLLAHFDHQALELWMYDTGDIGHHGDEPNHQARSRVHHWVLAKDFDGPQLATRIEADRIDILIDLSGHTANNRLALFAQRLAPVQVGFLGYPASTGLFNMDWVVADHEVAPPKADALFSEQIYRLPNTAFCFAPDPAQYPLPTWGPEHAQRPLTFGSFNNTAKLTPHTLALWAKVLQAVPSSRLVLKAPTFQNQKSVEWFRQRLVEQGIDPSRLEFRGPVGLDDMMAEYADIDIALDTAPYNGGTTTLQALWMGVPVLTLEGHNFVSRMGASFIKAAGLPDWVATTEAKFVQLAKRHAADRAALLELKKGLRAQLQQRPAWNAQAYTRDFEAGLRHMWQAFCEQNMS